MKFCQSHWDELRGQVHAKGMSHLIAADGKAAAKRMVEEVEGTATPDTYDPLMSCHWMIMTNALKAGGLYLMTDKSDGTEHCPLCEVEKNKEAIGEGAADWIRLATDSCLEYCRENKLIQADQ